MNFLNKKLNVCELSSFLVYFICIKIITVKLWGPKLRGHGQSGTEYKDRAFDPGSTSQGVGAFEGLSSRVWEQ